MDYATFKATAAKLDAEVSVASAALNAFPHDGPFGMTSDAVKFSPEYRAAQAAYRQPFEALRQLHARHAWQFQKEIRADRDARRAARLAG